MTSIYYKYSGTKHANALIFDKDISINNNNILSSSNNNEQLGGGKLDKSYYNFISDPISGKQFSIFSKKGTSILKNYTRTL
tara:strand:- start:320 stop:562 length:243 start_codon:yes stop_codon:yes gene_type:complete